MFGNDLPPGCPSRDVEGDDSAACQICGGSSDKLEDGICPSCGKDDEE